MKYATRFALAALVLIACLGSRAQAQVLDHVPQDAVVVIKINNLKAVSEKLAAIAKAWGIDAFNPSFADPLGSIQQESGVSQGLRNDGDMVIAILTVPGMPTADGAIADQVEADDDAGEDEPTVLALIPVSDYKAFLGNFRNVQTEGDISTVQFADTEETSYVTQWGQHAAISNVRSALQKKPAGLKPQGLAAKELSDKDIVMFGNLALLRKHVLPELQKNRQNILDQLEQDLKDDPQGAQLLPIARPLVSQALDVAQGFLRDAHASTWGIKLGDNGIGSTMLLEFTPDSTSAKQVARFKNSNDPMVTGLPDAQYIVYGGMAQDPKVTAELFDELFGQAMKELANLGEAGKVLDEYMSGLRQQLANVESQSFGALTPDNPMQGLMQVVSVNRGNAKEIAAGMRRNMQAEQQLMPALGAQAENPLKTTIKENARNVAGVQFDLITMQPDPEVRTPEAAQVAQMMQIMYGPQGLVAHMGAIDDKTLLTVVGGSDVLLNQAIAAAKGNERALAQAAPTRAVQAELPQNRIGVMYVRLDNIMKLGGKAAEMMGMQLNMQFKPDLQPLGITVGTEGSAVRVDAYLPNELVEGVISAAMQAMQAMQGGVPEGL